MTVDGKVGPATRAKIIELLALLNSHPAVQGDADGDGVVSAADALLVLRYSLDLAVLSPAQLEAADLDGDSGVTAADALLILRRSMEL